MKIPKLLINVTSVKILCANRENVCKLQTLLTAVLREVVQIKANNNCSNNNVVYQQLNSKNCPTDSSGKTKNPLRLQINIHRPLHQH